MEIGVYMMNQGYKKHFSLILSTVGNHLYVEKFINKLTQNSFQLSELELIIINQDDEDKFILMEKIKEKYCDTFDIILINTNQKGLSYARNIGMNFAGGVILGFPDDDCEYFEDTLVRVKEEFEKNRDIVALLGRVCDYNKNNVIRNWPHHKHNINWRNFYTRINSITLFVKARYHLEGFMFDEQLGVGRYFGSNEDSDFVWRLMKRGRVIFSPNVLAYHPHVDNISICKIASYGKGFGAFCRKNLSVPIFFLFIAIISLHIIRLFGEFFSGNKNNIHKRMIYITSRLNGFFSWTNCS